MKTLNYDQIKSLSVNEAPLFFVDPGERAPRSSYLNICKDGFVTAGNKKGGIDETPLLSWIIPANISGNGLLRLVEDNLDLLMRYAREQRSDDVKTQNSETWYKIRNVIYYLDDNEYCTGITA